MSVSSEHFLFIKFSYIYILRALFFFVSNAYIIRQNCLVKEGEREFLIELN